MADDGCRHDVAEILALQSPLDGNTDDVLLEQGRAPTVARIDGGIDLHEQKAPLRVDVLVDEHARHDPRGDREPLAAPREAVNLDLLLRPRKRTNGESAGASEELRIGNSQDRQIAGVGDVLDDGRIAPLGVASHHFDHRGAGHHVRSRQDALPLKDDPRTPYGLRPESLPGCRQIGLVDGDVDADDGLLQASGSAADAGIAKAAMTARRSRRGDKRRGSITDCPLDRHAPRG